MKKNSTRQFVLQKTLLQSSFVVSKQIPKKSANQEKIFAENY